MTDWERELLVQMARLTISMANGFVSIDARLNVEKALDKVEIERQANNDKSPPNAD